MGWKTTIYLPTLWNYLLLSAALWKRRLLQSCGCLAAHTHLPDAALLRSSRAIDQLRETSQWLFFWKTRTWLSSLKADESSLKLFWFCFDDIYIYIIFFLLAANFSKYHHEKNTNSHQSLYLTEELVTLASTKSCQYNECLPGCNPQCGITEVITPIMYSSGQFFCLDGIAA